MQLQIKRQFPHRLTEYERNMIIPAALDALSNYPLSQTDRKLDQVLKKETGKSLFENLVYLISNCTIQFNLFDEFTVNFSNREDDKIARLITYGTLEVKGSNILKKLFRNN